MQIAAFVNHPSLKQTLILSPKMHEWIGCPWGAGRMAHYKDFPHDSRYWLVKWIDGFRLTNAASQAVQVQLTLQAITKPPTGFSRLTANEIRDLIAFEPGGAAVEYQPHWHGVGSLPALQVGQVYLNGECVGTLPTLVQPLTLQRGEDSCADHAVHDDLPAPPEWQPWPYRLIHETEYSLPKPMRSSRCLVAEAGGNQYVIPRSVVFQRFYAFNTLLAHAFTSGPWSQTYTQAIYPDVLESGLRTWVDPESGAWHLILQPRMLDADAPLLALLYFHAYGRAAANRIYAEALRERGNNVLKPWHASAQLPFSPDAEPLRMRIKGFWLKDRGKANKVFKRTFLVTAILDVSYPTDAGELLLGRVNDNTASDDPTRTSASAPYNKGGQQSAPSDLDVDDSLEPSLERGLFVQSVETAGWFNPPEVKKLTKQHSKIYDGAARPPDEAGSLASTGPGGHQENGPTPLQVQALARPAHGRFEAVLEAMQQLVDQRDLIGFDVLPPPHPSWAAQRGGQACWNFLDPESRRSRRWPRSGWRLLKTGKGTHPVPRCALVLSLQSKTWNGYWIEIEGRSSTDTYTSPVITQCSSALADTMLEACIEAIALQSGRRLAVGIAPILGAVGGGRVQCYRHDYAESDAWALDHASLRRFLGRIR